MRYVVRNNFFGLESRAKLQKGIRATPDLTTGEQEGRQGKPAKEEVRAATQSVSPAGGERSSAESGTAVLETCKKQDVETSKAIVVDQHPPQNCQDQGLLTDQVCSKQSSDAPVDSAASAEQVSEDFIQTAEETTPRDCHSHDLAVADKPAFNVYDDEIWESPGVVL